MEGGGGVEGSCAVCFLLRSCVLNNSSLGGEKCFSRGVWSILHLSILLPNSFTCVCVCEGMYVCVHIYSVEPKVSY